jgi:molybdate/tungstate transport system substrate-binding protein
MLKKILMVLFALMLVVSCGKKETEVKENPVEKVKLTVFHAGSLAKPFKDVKSAFEAKYPNVEVLLEAAGSRACARKITEQKREADVMASADESVIRTLLFPDYADYCLNFVTNEMVIMYSDKSNRADEINEDNWYDVLLEKDVEYGHSEPDKDPCGYRTILVWQLVEKYYQETGLYSALKEGCPEKNVRPKEVDLLAMLDVGEIDYLFIYRSVAEQHHAKFITLPPEVNLGTFTLSDYYSSATVELIGKKPGETVTKKGAPMVYGITVPLNAPSKEWGTKFVEFVVGPEGNKIMRKNGHPIIEPTETLEFDKLPESLKKLAKQI